MEIVGTPGAVEAIQEGLADAAAARFVDGTEIKARHSLV
jgi:antitoxin YefM